MRNAAYNNAFGKSYKRDNPAMIGVWIIAAFLFFRPITVSFHHIGSISILDLYGIAISYLVLLGIIFNLKRVRLDLTAGLILFYMFYCLMNFAWGGTYRDIIRTILPFLPFFLTRAVTDEQNCTKFLWILGLGYVIPIAGSVMMILLGLSETVITGSMIERQSGLSSGTHTLGHLMLFFSFAYALYLLLEKGRTFQKLIMSALFIGSLLCIYKTVTRTVILGGIVFWLLHLAFWNKKIFLFLLIACCAVGIWKFDTLKKIITQEDHVSQVRHSKEIDINAASSGRIWIWQHNLKLYAEQPGTRQILGVGLGNELEVIPGSNKRWAGSHNDYMSLLITGGAIGLSLHLMIYAALIFSFFSAGVSFQLRMFFLSMLASVLLMNFVSNSYIVRFQMAQLFWFLMGLLLARVSIEKKINT
jgi:hypothetical protein